VSRLSRRRARTLAIIASAFALLAFAPGALAATLTVDGSGNLVYTAAAGKVSAVEFDETAPNTVQVHAVSGGSVNVGLFSFGPFTDNDTITPSGNCTADGSPDGNGDPTWTCTGVTNSVQATTLDGDDGVDATGGMSGLGTGLATIPLVANMGDDDDAVAGGQANDTLHGDAGDDGVFGDTGGPGTGSDDALFGDAGSDTLAGGKGNDSVDSGPDSDNQAVGGPGNDNVSGGDGDDGFVAGGPGDDSVSGGNGSDSVYGDCGGGCGGSFTDGNDTVNGDADGDFVDGEGGNDIVHGGDGDDEVRGDDNNSQAGNDQVFGGAGDDGVRAQAGNDTADGGDGNDFVAGGQGDDTTTGGAGDDDVEGASGADTVDGGPGEDYVTGDCGGVNFCGDGSDGNDTVTGGSGDDFSDADGGTDTIDLGSGFDTVEYQNRVGTTTNAVSVTLDGAANDGAVGENDSLLATEDVQISSCCGSAAPGAATIVGDAGTNSLQGGDGNDTIDGGAGNDFLYGHAGDDTLNANDGFADRVSCGSGADTANADEFDIVSDDCETVNRTTRGNLATEDAPPTVAWTTPASAAKLSSSKTNTLAVTASDDKGVSKVVFLAGERVICTVTAAPYTCAYKPTDADVGRTTLTAIAYDTSQQTASAIRVVSVPRFKPSKVTSSTSPKKDATAPFTFTTKGRVSLPSGVTRAAGCTGTVAVTFKAGKKTISTRKARVTKSCTFRSKVTFRLPSRLHPKSLRVQSTFRGNAVLLSCASSRKTVKVSL
jgi:Ca2+-binding RTX toxin-like protein